MSQDVEGRRAGESMSETIDENVREVWEGVSRETGVHLNQVMMPSSTMRSNSRNHRMEVVYGIASYDIYPEY